MNKTKRFIFTLTLLICQLFYAQVEKEKDSLINIIQVFEQQFDCHFSYADKTIENIFIKTSQNISSLKEAVLFLKEHTNLQFTILKDNFILISKKNNKTSFCGYLLDLETDEPIVNAVINADNQIVTSDDDGFFEFKSISINSKISISHISYKRVRYVLSQVKSNNCAPLYLVSKVEQITEIVIRNYLTKGIQKTVKGAYKIEYKKFDILPGLIEPDVLQTLQALPGVQSVDESVSNINIRGGAHHENLILWDEMKMYQSGHFFGLISAFNPYLTKNATLIKNGTDANYSEGVSGTILMRTSNEVTKMIKTEIGLNLINADVFLDMPIGNKSSIQLSARKSISNLVETPTYKQYFDKAFQNSEVLNSSESIINSDDEFSFYDVNVRWLYDITPYDKIRVNFLSFDNNLIFSENVIVGEREESKESSASQKNLATGVFYNRIWNNQFSTDLQLYTTKYNLESINHDILNNQRLIQENEVFEGSVKLDTEFKVSEYLTLFNGYHYQETGVTNIQDVDNPLFQKKVKHVVRSHGLFSQVGYQSENNETNIQVGFRLNYLEKFEYFRLEPRLSFSQQFLDNFTVQLLGEMKHQTATQVIDFQEDFLGIENRRWILANNGIFDEDNGGYNVPIVESMQGSLGIFYNNMGWLVSAEGYYKSVDGITTKSQGFQNQFQFVNATGNYHVFGADFLIRKRFRKLNSWFSYSYVNNRYEFNGLTTVDFPSNFDITHSVSFATSYSVKKFNISAGLNWHSGKPTTQPVSGNEIVNGEINYEIANSSRLEDYMRIDISSQYKFNISKNVKASAGISVWNLLNQENITNSYYKILDDTVNEVKQKSLGLTPNASFRVSF